jgi:surface polysaccharide O-acyltransferase-like enzyme
VKKRIEYISNLKALSILMVIFLHSASPLFYQINTIKLSDWLVTNFYDSSVRAAVPLFLMISGVTNLKKECSLFEHFKKMFFRLIVPYLLFAIIYIIKYKQDFLNILEPGKISYHFLFVPIILTLYLFYPILRIWLKNAKTSDIMYFLLLWCISLLINLHQHFIHLPLFFSFLGYPVLGFLLNKEEIKIKSNIALYLYCIGLLITFCATYFICIKNNAPDERYYEYLTVNVALMSIGIFTFFKDKNFQIINSKLIIIRDFLARHTYSLFFIHPMILGEFYFLHSKITPLISDILIFIAATFTSYIIIFLCSKIKFIRTIM